MTFFLSNCVEVLQFDNGVGSLPEIGLRQLIKDTLPLAGGSELRSGEGQRIRWYLISAMPKSAKEPPGFHSYLAPTPATQN